KDENQKQTLGAVLYRAAEVLRWLSVMLYPIMPNATREIYAQLGLTDDVSAIDPANLKWRVLSAGTQIGDVKAIFPRIDKAKTMDEIEEQESGVRSREPEAAETRPSGRVQSSELANEAGAVSEA